MFRIPSVVLVLVNTRISHVTKNQNIARYKKSAVHIRECSRHIALRKQDATNRTRHTSDNIAEWTKTALIDIGLTAKAKRACCEVVGSAAFSWIDGVFETGRYRCVGARELPARHRTSNTRVVIVLTLKKISQR